MPSLPLLVPDRLQPAQQPDWSVYRFVSRLGANAALPFRRIEVDPGTELQVDFGTGAKILLSGGKHRRTHVFRAVLSHSRKGYTEAVYRLTTESFIRSLENAFWALGGVPKTIVFDNAKCAVIQADWYDPELNPRIVEFCKHYGCAFIPTRPRTPRRKGKVERGIDYVQENALRGREFESLSRQNEHLDHWERTVADTRQRKEETSQVLPPELSQVLHEVGCLPFAIESPNAPLSIPDEDRLHFGGERRRNAGPLRRYRLAGRVVFPNSEALPVLPILRMVGLMRVVGLRGGCAGVQMCGLSRQCRSMAF